MSQQTNVRSIGVTKKVPRARTDIAGPTEPTNVQSFASESVCAGHPDKVADAISDAIVDAVLAQDPNGRTAVETLVAHDRIVLAGEINTFAKIDAEAIAREQVRKLGY